MSAVMETRAPAQHPLMLEVMRQQRVIEDQAAVIRDLRQALAGDAVAPAEWGLLRREAQIYAALARHQTISRERLFFAVYGECEVANTLIVQSHISRLRKKIRPFGLDVRVERFIGYTLVDLRSERGGAA